MAVEIRKSTEELNKQYQKSKLVEYITEMLQTMSKKNPSWNGLPNCDESYKCLNKLNKVVLIKLYECLMMF